MISLVSTSSGWSMAKEIAFARNSIEKADPDAWKQLTRQYLATTLNSALKVTQQGETRNLAGKLYQAMAGTPEQLAKLQGGLGELQNAQAMKQLLQNGRSHLGHRTQLIRDIKREETQWFTRCRRSIKRVIKP